MNRQLQGNSTAARIVVAAAVLAALGWMAVPSVNTLDFSAWLGPVSLGPDINTADGESGVAVSKNGLSLYFASSRPGGLGLWDLWVAQRASVQDEWGPGEWLGLSINSDQNETHPALSLDEHRLYFISNRSGSCGLADIYVSRRHDRRDDLGWEPAENLGCIGDGYVNGPAGEATPAFFEDENGRVIMYFAKSGDIYASIQRDDDSFGPPELVAGLNTTSSESGATVRRDGLEVIFASNRSGGVGNMDLWMATRDSTNEVWSNVTNLAGLNSTAFDGCRTSLSFDGLTLYFTSERAGSRDLYMATRTRLR